MKDLIFRNLHGLKHEILKKSRRVIFFRFLYFPYVSKGSKNLKTVISGKKLSLSVGAITQKLFDGGK